MSVAKVLEISASSNKSFEDAIQTGISRVNTSVDQVQGAWIQEQKSWLKPARSPNTAST